MGDEKNTDTAWHTGLIYKLRKLEFSTSLINIIASFLWYRKFSVYVKIGMSTPSAMQAGALLGSVLSPTQYNMYINDSPKYLVFIYPSLPTTLIGMRQFANRVPFSESCSAVSAQWRRGISVGTLNKMTGIYFSRRRGSHESHLALKGRNIPFVNRVKYLLVIFDRKIIWRTHREMVEAKAFRTVYSTKHALGL